MSRSHNAKYEELAPGIGLLRGARFTTIAWPIPRRPVLDRISIVPPFDADIKEIGSRAFFVADPSPTVMRQLQELKDGLGKLISQVYYERDHK